MIALFLIEEPLLFFTEATPINIPTSSTTVPFPPPTSVTLVMTSTFDDSHSIWCEVVAHCGFDFYFPGD